MHKSIGAVIVPDFSQGVNGAGGGIKGRSRAQARLTVPKLCLEFSIQ
jgi:hypothetical protein